MALTDTSIFMFGESNASELIQLLIRILLKIHVLSISLVPNDLTAQPWAAVVAQR